MQHTKQLQHTIIFHYSERSAPQVKGLAPNEAFYLRKPNTDLANSPTNVLAHPETRLLHQVLAILCQLYRLNCTRLLFRMHSKYNYSSRGGATTMNIINCERTTHTQHTNDPYHFHITNFIIPIYT